MKMSYQIYSLIILFLYAHVVVLSCSKNNPINSNDKQQGKLVFVIDDSNPNLYTMNIDGSDLKRILAQGDTIRNPNGSFTIVHEYAGGVNPRWSPNGNKIACGYEDATDVSALLLMNADGSDKNTLPLKYGSAYRPQWSPEGDRILFMRGVYLGAKVAVGIIDTNGNSDRDFEIAGNINPYLFEGDSVWFTGDYQWGPVGNLIYGLGSIGKKPEPAYIVGTWPEHEIFSFSSRTGEVLQQLTKNKLDEGGFRLSPDGQYAAFKRGAYGRPSSLLVLSLIDSTVIHVTATGYIDPVFNWSSDSKKIVFAMDEDPDIYRNEDYHLYLVDIQHPKGLIRLTSFRAKNPDLFIPE